MWLKSIGFVIILFCTIPPGFGRDILMQENDLDLMQNDTAKVNLLIELGQHYCSTENQKAIFYLQEALVLLNKLNYRKGIIFSCLWQGRVYYYKDEYDLAKTYLGKAKVLLEEPIDNEGLILYYFASASINNLTGDYLSALKNNQELVRLSKISGNKLMLSVGLQGMGSIYNNRNEPERALLYLQEALTTKLQIDDKGELANVITNIGYTWELLGNYDSAMYYYGKGFEIRKKMATFVELPTLKSILVTC